MNTFWLKLAALAVGIVVAVVLIGMLTGGEPQPKEPDKGFYDQVEEDKREFLTKPRPLDNTQREQPEADEIVVAPVQPVQQPPKPEQPTTLYFTELSEIDKVEAERYLNVAVPGRSIGRLPTTGFGLMVQNCRRIMQRWPGSWYDYTARKMLADMPERYQKRYNVTDEEKDTSQFAEPRTGTKPFVMEESR